MLRGRPVTPGTLGTTRPLHSIGGELCRPAPLAALAVLALNDHVLKGAGLLPGALTGKLSDFAGLFLFPVLLFVLLRVCTSSSRQRLAWASAGLTALGFAGVKLHPETNALVSATWGPMLLDPTDLVALPMVALAACWLRREPPAASRPARLLAVMATSLACGATSRPQVHRAYPEWRLETLGARQLGCARIEPWISKSGKEGFGLSIMARKAQAGDCRVEVVSAEAQIDGAGFAAERTAPLELGHDDRFLYVPFVFDNQAQWNAGKRTGTLTVALRFNGQVTETLRVSMRHVFDAPHRHESGRAPIEPARPPLVMAEPDAGGGP